MRRFDRANNVEYGCGQITRRLELGVEARELQFGGQFAIEEKPGSLLKRRMLSEVMNGIAAVAQFTSFAVDKGARRPIEINAFETALNLDRSGCFRSLMPSLAVFAFFSRGEKHGIARSAV
jgi:hypothetical protein